MGSHETEKLFHDKEHHHRTKMTAYRKGNIFTNCTSDKGLSKIYKELKKLDIKKTNNPIKMRCRSKQRILNRGNTNY